MHKDKGMGTAASVPLEMSGSEDSSQCETPTKSATVEQQQLVSPHSSPPPALLPSAMLPTAVTRRHVYVGEDSELPLCCGCSRPFDTDLEEMDDPKNRLPFTCRACFGFSFCYDCLRTCFENHWSNQDDKEEHKGDMMVACPGCFRPGFDLKRLFPDRNVCHLLQLLQKNEEKQRVIPEETASVPVDVTNVDNGPSLQLLESSSPRERSQLNNMKLPPPPAPKYDIGLPLGKVRKEKYTEIDTLPLLLSLCCFVARLQHEPHSSSLQSVDRF